MYWLTQTFEPEYTDKAIQQREEEVQLHSPCKKTPWSYLLVMQIQCYSIYVILFYAISDRKSFYFTFVHRDVTPGNSKYSETVCTMHSGTCRHRINGCYHEPPENDESTLGASSLTISFAPFTQQQFDDTKKTFGGGQMQRPVTHLTTQIHICPKLQQQLRHLEEQEIEKNKKKHMNPGEKNISTTNFYQS